MLFTGFALLGVKERDPTETELIIELQVHTHAYKHVLVEQSSKAAVGVDSSLPLTVGSFS